MNIQSLIESHQQELNNIKSQMYDAERRVIELQGILAALYKVKEMDKKGSDAE